MDSEIGSFASSTGNLETAVLEPEKKEIVIDNGAEEASRIAAEKTALDKKTADESDEKAKKDASSANPNLAEEKEEKPAVVETEEKKPKGMTDEGWTSWKNLRASEKAAKAEAATARAELEENKKRLGEIDKHSKEAEDLRKDNEALKKSITDYEGVLSIHKVESSAKYKTKVTDPRKEITATVEEISKRYDLPPGPLIEAIKEKDREKRKTALLDLISDFDELDKIDINQSVKDWIKTEHDSQELLADASKQAEEIDREAKGNQEAMRVGVKKEYDTAFQSEWEKALLLTPKVKKVAGSDGWNKHLDSIAQEGVSLDPNDIPVEVLAKLKASELLLPKVLESLNHLDTENKRLKDELAAEKKRNKEYRSTELKAGAGANGENGDTKDAFSFAESVMPRG